jgi:hypothetical protein
MVQTVFDRYESKYLISRDQFEALMPVLADRMRPDRYASYAVTSIYYDTADYRLVRRALEKPVYREKLRLRCYGRADADTGVFLELKKKYKKRAYKRRICLPYGLARDFPEGGWDSVPGKFGDLQIKGEIRQFLRLYQVQPRVLIRYDRTAFQEEPGLRVTFDRNLRFREDDFVLNGDPGGVSLLPPEKVLMEIKTPDAIPLWLCRLLSGQGIFPVSFSKYGSCYTNFIMEPRRGGAAARHVKENVA